MASPNPRAAEVNYDLVIGLAEKINSFVDLHNPRNAIDQTAQDYFNKAILLCTDPFSDIETVSVGSMLARKLHPWVTEVKIGDKFYTKGSSDAAEATYRLASKQAIAAYIANRDYEAAGGPEISPTEYMECLRTMQGIENSRVNSEASA